jgi:DNA-binding beta-propeller fold protein YncE
MSLVACGGGLNDNRFPTGSDTIAASAKYDAVVTVNPDEGTISRVDLATQKVTELIVGAEPTRIARAGNRFFVTLRGERAIAVISADFEVEKMIQTGAEPFGVVASENGKRVYVSVSQANQIIEIDANKLEKLRTFKVADEPRWLALHPSDKSLYVASAFAGRLTRIDLRSGDRSRVELPHTTRFIDDDESVVELTVRITGDLAVTPDGQRLVVPVVYVDNETTVEEPVDGRPVQNGYGASGMTLGRINPSVVRIPLGRGGVVKIPNFKRDQL